MWCRTRWGWYCDNCDRSIQTMKYVAEPYLSIGSTMFIPGSIDGGYGMICEACAPLFEIFFSNLAKSPSQDSEMKCHSCGESTKDDDTLNIHWTVPFPGTRNLWNGQRVIRICSKEKDAVLDELQTHLTNPLSR